MKYHFYCYDDDPEECPDAQIMFAVTPDRDQFDQIGPMIGWGTPEQQEKISRLYAEARDRFKAEIVKIGCEIVDNNYIRAKDIPAIKVAAEQLGWKNEYIPFGP